MIITNFTATLLMLNYYTIMYLILILLHYHILCRFIDQSVSAISEEITIYIYIGDNKYIVLEWGEQPQKTQR